jgi:hypothetical protein
VALYTIAAAAEASHTIAAAAEANYAMAFGAVAIDTIVSGAKAAHTYVAVAIATHTIASPQGAAATHTIAYWWRDVVNSFYGWHISSPPSNEQVFMSCRSDLCIRSFTFSIRLDYGDVII